MCGIVGFTCAKKRWRKDINAMVSALSHRGPDGSDVWHDDCGVVLGHTRLSIIDLSDAGNQPMVSEDERLVLSFNGEIYNYKELREELCEYAGMRFRGKSDTEVLLAAFSVYGIEKTLEKVIGMFAISLYDRKNKELLLVRDRMGEKPLYYAKIDDSFVWASELSAMCQYGGFNHVIDETVLPLYFKYGYIPAPYSIYKDVFKLEAGSCIRIGIDGRIIKKWKYWDVCSIASKNEDGLKGITEDEAALLFEEMLRKTVRRQLRSDVPVGVYLSGGIDSSMIAMSTSQVSNDNVHTFSIGFSEKDYDESCYANEIADYLGTKHEKWIINSSDLADAIPKMLSIYQEPYADNSQLPTYLLSRLAKKRVTVVLSGDGGDEICCGYQRYMELTDIFDRIKNGQVENCRGISNYKWRLFLGSNSLEQVYRDYFLWGSEVLGICRLKEGKESVIDSYFNGFLKHDMNNLMLMDQLMYLPDDILTKVDRSGMAVSLENRIPLLDHEIVEFMWKIPLSLKINSSNQKMLFKKVLAKNIPSRLWEREKKGFNVPMKDLFSLKKVREWACDLLSYDKIKAEGYLDEEVVNQLWNDYLKNGNWKPQIWYAVMFESFMSEVLDNNNMRN